ncbi:MAG: helix-turn-helix domain-containing protein, partial [Alphaproteobacteria bacterium]|nr:helix-turn-helix domain-containing protein [Alphaproteobacteria bacterium]
KPITAESQQALADPRFPEISSDCKSFLATGGFVPIPTPSGGLRQQPHGGIMPATAPLPKHLRPRREKVFGQPQGFPLDRNAKARVMVYARAYNARAKQHGQHRGPITRAFFEVLEALLWGFHNAKTGLCFPSYERIAEKAGCCRDTVYEAIKALEFANVLTWVNRLTRIRTQEPDLFGHWALRWRTIRTSNAYVFRDPLPCAHSGNSSKSENPTGTKIQELSLENRPPLLPQIIVLDPENRLDGALIRLGRSLGALPQGANS